MCCVDHAARRILALIGQNTEKVVTTVGPEQEYFLIDKEMWQQRKDLVYAGRTLFGAKMPKGQERTTITLALSNRGCWLL